jgi:hypothetical protein
MRIFVELGNFPNFAPAATLPSHWFVRHKNLFLINLSWSKLILYQNVTPLDTIFYPKMICSKPQKAIKNIRQIKKVILLFFMK